MKNNKKVNLTSSNLSEKKQEELRRILPEAFSENKIDWEKLRAVLGDKLDERIEKFSFSWAGKSNAIKNVLIPSKATLSPAKDESVKFDTSENLFIEGDNLEVLKLLQKAYFEQVKMIYIDPPYNTGGDFVYHDNFAAPLKNYLQQTGQVDVDGNKLQTNKETSGRYHSDWLSMMYPRFKLAWNLLRDDGVIFVSIDDHEVAHLRMMLDEIFGEENFLASIVWQKKYAASNDAKGIPAMHDYILTYQKSVTFKRNLLPRTEKQDDMYKYDDNDGKGRWRSDNLLVKSFSENYVFPIINPNTGKAYNPPKGSCWRASKETIEKWLKENRIFFGKDGKGAPQLKRYLNEVQAGLVPNTWWGFDLAGHNDEANKEMKAIFQEKSPFDTPKPTRLVKLMLQIATNGKEEELIMDFFAGSGTTAHAVLKQNQEDGGKRKFILVQLPEATDVESEAYKSGYKTIADISVERIRRAIKGFGDNPQPIDDGFKVFKLTESNYPENQFEFDPEKSEEENKKAFADYLGKAKQAKLFADTKSLDVVYENVVKEGLSLNSKITEQKIGKNTSYVVTDGERQLLVCLDKKIDEKTVSELTSKDFKGKTFICLDNALDDTAKANLGLNVELKTI